MSKYAESKMTAYAEAYETVMPAVPQWAWMATLANFIPWVHEEMDALGI